MEERKKVYIIEEIEYKIPESPPPNFFSWFKCVKMYDKFSMEAV